MLRRSNADADALWEKFVAAAPETTTIRQYHGGSSNSKMANFWTKMAGDGQNEDKMAEKLSNPLATMQNRRSDDIFSSSSKPEPRQKPQLTTLHRLAQLLKKKKKPHGDIHEFLLHKPFSPFWSKSS